MKLRSKTWTLIFSFDQKLASTNATNGNPFQCSCLENPRDGKPGGLPSMGSHRVGHDGGDLAVAMLQNNFS